MSIEQEEKFRRLLIAYGNASYDCGAYESEDRDDYVALNNKSEHTRQKVIEAYLQRGRK